jgi:uncharacterized protein (DUF2062 family)
MPRKLLKRLLPSVESIKANRWLRPVDQFFHEEKLWHIHQRNIAKACFIGIFVAFTPLPGHTLIAAMFAILFGANIIVSIAMSWIVANPLTYAPIFYLDYFIGSKIWGSHLRHIKFELTLEWLYSALPKIGAEMFTGAVICGLLSGWLGYWAVRFFWRWRIGKDWKQRQLNRSNKTL